MKILVTGSTGMVGKNILDHPEFSLHEIFAPTSSELDLLDYELTSQYIKKIKPDLIIHAAGIVGGIQANINNPVKFFLHNLDMGRNIVFAAHNHNIGKLINLGSSCMYPRNSDQHLKEEMILSGELEPTNEGYALAKIATAKLCQYINAENTSHTYKTLVPCNLYGKWDKFDTNSSHMIPAVIKKIHEAKIHNKNEVVIWGDGEAKREFMFSSDLADCLAYAIENYTSLPNVMNTGLGHDHTINEYYSVIAKVIGYKGNFIHDLEKPVGMHRKVVDIDKQSHWGWKPKSSLEEGIKATYNFYLQNEGEL